MDDYLVTTYLVRTGLSLRKFRCTYTLLLPPVFEMNSNKLI